jgi:hypothetical protein
VSTQELLEFEKEEQYDHNVHEVTHSSLDHSMNIDYYCNVIIIIIKVAPKIDFKLSAILR